MFFCKKAICIYSIILCAACHPEGSVNSVLLSHQNRDRQLMYRYLLRKPDSTYLYSIAYDTNKLNFSVLIHVVTKDSSHVYQYFQNPDFITQRLGNAGLVVND